MMQYMIEKDCFPSMSAVINVWNIQKKVHIWHMWIKEICTTCCI